MTETSFRTVRYQLMERALLAIASGFLFLTAFLSAKAIDQLERLEATVQHHEVRIAIIENS